MQKTIIMPSNHNADDRSVTTTGRWLDFWNAPDEIFVHPAHMRRHFHRLTEGFFRYAPQVKNGRLLDYGCGEALAAERFAAEGLITLLYDRSDYYRELVRKNYAGKEKIVVLDERGKELMSEDFARFIEDERDIGTPITFVIGGAYGLDDTIRSKAQLVLSLGKMTFPHELAKLLLLEQLFRADSILRRSGYHH